MSKKFWLGFIAALVVFVILDFIIHGLILRGMYEETKDLWREEMNWTLSYIVTIIYIFLFSYVFYKFVGNKNVIRGLGFGFFLGIAWGVSMGYGSYSYMPIPYWLAFSWFITTVVEMSIVGLILGLIIKEPPEGASQQADDSSPEPAQAGGE